MMSDEITIGPKRAPFSWLPNYLVNDQTISAEALAAALYLNGKPAGWRVRPFDLRKRFGWGERIWLRVSKELRALGMLHESVTKLGSALSFQLPEMEIKPTRHFVDPANCRPAEMSCLNKKDCSNKKDLLNDHEHDGLKKDSGPSNPKPPKLSVKARIANLCFDEKCIYDKLIAMRGIFPGTAIAIVEANTIGKINLVIEYAFGENIQSPVGYIIDQLYTKLKDQGTKP